VVMVPHVRADELFAAWMLVATTACGPARSPGGLGGCGRAPRTAGTVAGCDRLARPGVVDPGMGRPHRGQGWPWCRGRALGIRPYGRRCGRPLVDRAPDSKSEGSTRPGSPICLPCLVIRLVIRTIRRDPSGSVWIDEAPNVSRPDPPGADQFDAEHQATDLVWGSVA
jgi:hypothetical protein